MVTEQPNVQPNSRYTVTETCKLLGIHRNSLLKYTYGHENEASTGVNGGLLRNSLI